MPAKESGAACKNKRPCGSFICGGIFMFWDSTAGRALVLIAALAALALTGLGLRGRLRARNGAPAGKRGIFSVKVLTYSAICIALSLVLSRFKLFQMPQGGDVTPCSMLFITLTGYWFGPEVGILAGVSEGLLRFVISSTGSVGPLQILLDFPLAFGALGAAGFFRNMPYIRFRRSKAGPAKASAAVSSGLFTGYVAGALALFCVSFVSGFVYWASYAPQGENPVLYSAVYNLAYVLPEVAITCALLAVPQFRAAIERIKKQSIG